MPPVVPLTTKAQPPPGYRRLGTQALRIDIAEKLLRSAHEARMAAGGKGFVLDPARAVSTGLTTASYASLLRLGGFRAAMPSPLAEGRFGPPRPPLWRWQPQRRSPPVSAIVPAPPVPGNVFAELLR